MISQLIKQYYDGIPDFLLRRLPVRSIIIEPIAGCNINCLGCPANHVDRKKGVMSYNDYVQYIDQFKDLRQVGLYFMGEPLLNSEIFQMIQYNAGKGIRTNINTNTTTLYYQYKEIVDSGLTKLVISLDGYSPETHERYRKGSSFNNAKEGMEKLSQYMKDVGSELIVDVRTLMFNGVEDEIDAIENFVKILDFTHRKIKPIVEGWGGQENPLADEMRDEDYRRDKVLPYCNNIFRVVVLWDGTVVPCCVDVHGSVVFGNLKKQNFNSMYNSNGGIEIRRNMFKRHFQICKRCGEW